MSAHETVMLWTPRAAQSPRAADVLVRAEKAGIRVERARPGVSLSDVVADLASEGVGLVVAAGGDGTASAAASGLVRAGGATGLAVLPMGTGNDFCRTLGLARDPLMVLEHVLARPPLRAVDAIEMIADGRQPWLYVNVASAGNAARAGQRAGSQRKSGLGSAAYLVSAAEVAGDLQTYRLQASFDDEEPTDLDCLALVVANGRTAGGGFPAAPAANPEDGLLDFVALHDGTLADVVAASAQLVMGADLDSDRIAFRTARSVELRCEPALPLVLDGETVPDAKTVRFELRPAALRVVVGPDYQPCAPEA